MNYSAIRHPLNVGHCLKQALVAGVLTMLVIGPISNVVLDQYSFNFLPLRLPIMLNGIYLGILVAIGRFLFSMLAQSAYGHQLLESLSKKKEHHAAVDTTSSQKRRLTVSLFGLSLVCCMVLAGLGLSEIVHKGAAFALILIILFVWLSYGIGVPKLRGQPNTWRLLVPLLFLAGFILPVILNQMGLLPKVWVSNLTLALIYVLLGLGLNIVVGMAGLLDLGFVAFYAVGAYFLAMGAQYIDMGFWTALLLAPVLAVIAGAILGFPVLRMHGDYLAIVTLGFGEIIRLVLTNWVDVTGGPNGMPAPSPTLFGLEFSRRASDGGQPFHEFFNLPYSGDYKALFIYMILFAVVAVMLRFLNRLRYMPIGRSWEALREDEIACRSLGINHVTVKLSAFMLGALSGGVAGVFFATYQGFINPSSFNFFESVLILSIVVLGGMGSTLGIIIAALALTLLPELMRDLANYRILLFGVLMIAMMIWRPYGLIRPKRPTFTAGGRNE